MKCVLNRKTTAPTTYQNSSERLPALQLSRYELFCTQIEPVVEFLVVIDRKNGKQQYFSSKRTDGGKSHDNTMGLATRLTSNDGVKVMLYDILAMWVMWRVRAALYFPFHCLPM